MKTKLGSTAMAKAGEENKSVTLTDEDDETVVKLLAYTIVALKRGDEKIMDGGEGSVIVTQKMTGETFTSWILARYLQQEVTAEDGSIQRRGDLIPKSDLKYLRVYYVVSNRWPRQPLEYEEKNVAILQKISDSIPKL